MLLKLARAGGIGVDVSGSLNVGSEDTSREGSLGAQLSRELRAGAEHEVIDLDPND